MKTMGASFRVRAAGDITVIDISGRLTLGDPVDGFLESVTACRSGKMILNLSELAYIDSAGLGELIAVNKQSQVRLVNVPKRVEDLLRLTGNYALFNVQADEQAAATSLP